MHHDLVEQLKTLKAIRPRDGYLACSRREILNRGGAAFMPRFSWVESLSPSVLRLAGVVALLLLVVGIPAILLPARPVLSSSLNPDSIREEIQQTLAIQVEELRYEQRTNQAVNAALDEIMDTSINHLNADVLESELKLLFESESSPAPIDDLLDQVLE